MTNYPGVQLTWRRVLAIAQNQPDPAAEIDFEDQLDTDALPENQDATMSPYINRLHGMSRALQNLFTITGQDEGYIAFLSTMTTELKYDCPVSMAFVKHIIDFSEIPGKEVLQNTSIRFLTQINNAKRDEDQFVPISINQNIIWSILAQKYAGNLIESMWIDQIGDILMSSLMDDSSDLMLRLYSLLALESFAMTGCIKQKLISQYQIVHVLERVHEEVELKMSIIQYMQQQQPRSLLSDVSDSTLVTSKRQSFSGRKVYQDLKHVFLICKSKLKRRSDLKKRQSIISTNGNISDSHISGKYASFPSAKAAQPIIPKSERERDTWFELMQLRHSLWWSLEHVFQKECLQTPDKDTFSTDTALPRTHLNHIDHTSHCKLSANRLEVRNDTHFFESVRANTCIANSGRWYYEVLLLTSGVMQIGWGTSKCLLSPQDGSGIGDDRNGFAFDTYRSAIWSSGERIYAKCKEKVNRKVGDVLGCLIDLDEKQCTFYMNGQDQCLTAGFGQLNLADDTVTLGLFPTISLTGYQHVLVNLGNQPWLFSPPVTNFKSVSEATIVVESYLEKDSEAIEYEWDGPLCTICFSEMKNTKLLPCGHDGFGRNCAEALALCPLCRAEIQERIVSKK